MGPRHHRVVWTETARRHLEEAIGHIAEDRPEAAIRHHQVRETGRPLVLTQHGRSAAVLLGAADYEALIEELEVLRDVQISERELAEGKGIPHEQVVQNLREIVRSRLSE